MKCAVRSCLAVLVAAGGLAAASSALAQPAGGLPCDGVKQDRNACLRERGAAAQTSRQGGFPKVDEAQLRQNALARCGRQPPADQAACEARVLGTGQTSMTGSVLGGGVMRITETPVAPGTPGATLPPPAVAPMPRPAAPMPPPPPSGQRPVPMPMPMPAPAR